MRDARFEEIDRVLENEARRHGNVGQTRHSRGLSVFGRSLNQASHPLDRKYRCGFDPKGVSIRQYRLHIANCSHRECRERLVGWLDLSEYFRTK